MRKCYTLGGGGDIYNRIAIICNICGSNAITYTFCYGQYDIISQLNITSTTTNTICASVFSCKQVIEY